MIKKENVKAVESYLDDLAGKGNYNGTVLVAEGNKILFKKAYGYANFEWKVKNRINTKYKIGSITKPLTACMIILLAQKKLLSFDDKLSKHIENTPKKWKDITIEHLLTHTSGISNFQLHKDWTSKLVYKTFKPLEFLKIIMEMKQEFEPGKDFSYSNSGYFLLGIIIEKVTGTSYEKALKKYVFEPLKMTNSGICSDEEVITGFAAGYTLNNSENDKIEIASYSNMSTPFSAGGLYSTVEDLFKFSQGLENKNFLKKKYYKYLTNGLKQFGDILMSEYTYGWFRNSIRTPDMIQREFICHNGVIPGYNCRVDKVLNENITIVFLSNILDWFGSKTDLYNMSAQVMLKLYKNENSENSGKAINKVKFIDNGSDVTLVKKFNNEILLSSIFENKKDDASVFFVNRTENNLKLYCLDIYGNRKCGYVLNPNKPFDIKWMTLYVIWEITDETDNSLGFYKIHRQGKLNIEIKNRKATYKR
jgi:CubicO group peptidase (beta-lactamase class C family)